MKKEGKRKIMPFLLTLILILSVLVFVPQSSIADEFIGVFPDGINWKTAGLTCGDELIYKVTTRDLEPETDYILQIDNGTEWIELEDGESTRDGDLFIEFNAPGWANLDPDNNVDPIGTWDLRLWNEDTDTLEPGYEAQIDVANLYHMEMKYDGDWIDNLIYNTTYAPIYFYIYNWSGSGYVLADDLVFDLEIYQPDGATILADYNDLITGIWDIDITDEDLDFQNGIGNLEYNLPITIDDGTHTTVAAIPVMLAVTADYPDDAVWGDTIRITGYVKDGQDKGIGGYGVALYSPVNGGYAQARTEITYSTGRYSMSVVTGYESDTWSAGTWYIGTIYPGGLSRVAENDSFEYPIDLTDEFIRYHWFDVAPDDNVDIEIESPDEITVGFEQEINVSCKWDNEPFNHPTDDDAISGNASVHVTGLDCYYNGTEYEEDDIVYVGTTQLEDNNDSSYCIFDVIFNETGIGTIIVTHPNDNDDLDWPMYNNTDLAHNISGSLDFRVGSSADFNLVVENMPDHVEIEIVGDCWINDSTYQIVEIYVYGDEEDDEMNASIHVMGAGLDFTIDEYDEVDDNEYLLDKDEGWYQIMISPKTGGTISITATNSTEYESITKDFKISGLKTSSVTTSVGDDSNITFGKSETIIYHIYAGDYADVFLTWCDKKWDNHKFIDKKRGDGETDGEGLNGIFKFNVTENDIPFESGYLIIVGEAADLYCYDIVEIEKPILKNIFIIGRITNLNQLEETSTFNSIRVRCINLSTFLKNKYQSNEKIIISNNYIGILTKWYILGFFEGALA